MLASRYLEALFDSLLEVVDIVYAFCSHLSGLQMA